MSLKSLLIGVALLAMGVLAGVLITASNSGPHVAAHADAGLMCTEHGVPESICTRCNSSLIDEFKERGDWCAEHGLPESQCALCNPALADQGIVPPGETADPHAGHNHAPGEGHDAPVAQVQESSELTGHNHYPGLSVIYRTNQPLCPTDQASIQFASVETAQRAGIEVQPVVVALSTITFEAPAEVVFDQNATTTLTSTVPVSVTRWVRDPGVAVKQGDVIAMAESPDLALLEGEHLEAWADWQMHDREEKRAAELLARGLLDSASFDRAAAEAVSAEARFVQSESRLRLAGLAETDVRELRERKAIGSRFAVRATMDGVLLERIAPLGILLDPGAVLVRIGNPAGLWIEAQVRESDLSRVALGQQVEFSADGNAMRRAPGEIIWISQFLDPHSRTATVRVRPSHNIDILRAHGFGRVTIAETGASATVMVPRDAVQWEGCCNVVFVREAPDRFRPRKVEVARGNASHYRVIDGLHPNDEVVVRGSFLLKTELKKGSIGAGCCGLEASS